MAARDDILPEELTQEQNTVVAQIVDRVIPIVYPSGIDTGAKGRVRQPRQAQDISRPYDVAYQDLDGFYGLVKRALDDKQIDDGVEPEHKILYTEESPPIDLVTEVITFKLNKRLPATMGGKAWQGNHQELKPRIRSVEDDKNNPGFKMFTMGQQFENEVVLTCWAKTNKQANKRALWLEDTLREYAWFLKYNGVMEYFLDRRLEDLTIDLTGEGNILHARPLVYYVRTERLTHLSEPTIRRVIVNYSIDANNQ